MFAKSILSIVMGALSFQTYAFDLFRFQEPALQKTVGIGDLSIIDTTREEPHSEDSLKRELDLRLWFPAIDDTKQDFAYWGFDKRSAIIEAVAEEKGLPRRLIDVFYPTHSRSKENLDVAPGKHPVVFLLHGLGGGTVEEHSALAERLAESGYFVVGVDFPFGALVATHSQLGRIVRKSARLENLIQRYPETRTDLTKYRKNEHEIWVADLLFAAKTLPSTKYSRLQNMDWTKLVIIGHSHGGMVALEACLKLENCVASVNMDGWTRTIEFPKDLKKHLLLFAPSTQDDSSGISFRSFCNGREHCRAEEVTMCDLGHSGFSDKIYLKWPLTYFTKNQCGDQSLAAADYVTKTILEFIRSS